MRIESMARAPLWLLTLALAGLGGQARAQVTLPPPSGVLNLSSSATVEVPRDTLNVVFSTTREGSDAQQVQAGLKAALDAALAEARKIARPGEVEVQTGNFALYPRYGAPNPRTNQPAITGWQGSAELIVHGRDAAAIAQLTGRVQTLTIARVGYTLSREARAKVEADVTAEAIARWRAKAAQMSQLFGYGGYTVREVSAGTNDAGPAPMVAMARAKTLGMAEDAALPTEAGKAEVTATVNGSVQMTK